MATWSKLSVPKGIYISPSFYVSNSLDRYIANIEDVILNPHFEQIDYFFRASYDETNWSEWKRFYNTSSDFLDGSNLVGIYVQFKFVITASVLEKKPYIQNFKIELKPYSHIDNIGDATVKPKLWIHKKNSRGNIAIINHETRQRFELKDLNNNEEVYIDCENEEIVSSNQYLGVYRYDSHNDEFLEFIRGDNHLTFEGDFDLDVRFKAILLQE